MKQASEDFWASPYTDTDTEELDSREPSAPGPWRSERRSAAAERWAKVVSRMAAPEMPAACPQYTVPLQRPRLQSDARPHTVHASSSTFVAAQEEELDQQTPRGSFAGLGALAEAGERRLSRDDTAADVSELLPELVDPNSNDSEMQISYEEVWNEGCSNARTQREPRRSVFRMPSNFTPSGFDGGAIIAGAKSQSLGRKFSRTIKENVSKYATPGRIRRSSTPQSIDAGSHLPKFSGVPVPPTSPSKRNGRHDGDRPYKLNRTFKTANERKDTPAPGHGVAAGPSQMASRTVAPSIPGGQGARQAAAAYNAPLSSTEALWHGHEDLVARRNRVGSISSAADSGADLGSYCGSNTSSKDADGDVEMTSDDSPEREPARDPVKTLPSEIMLHIIEYLDAQDLVQAEVVSRSWHELACKTSVWRTAFLRQYERQLYTEPAPIHVGGVGCGRPNRPDQQWKRMHKARRELDANWRKGAKGAGKAIYLAGHTDSVYCLQFDEEKIITGSRDRTIRVWDINNFTCQRVIGGPNVRPVTGPKVLRTVDYPDFHLATASVNGTAYGESIYQTPSEWHDASILCLQYDDKILVTGSSDSDLLIWDIKTYEPIKRLIKHTGGVLDVALDAKHIVSCSKDSRIIVWDRDTYEAKGELTGHRGPVNAVQLRGKFLVSASGDGIARLWDLNQMKLVREFSAKERGLAAVEFSEDMKYVLAGGNDTITYKFETETGKELKQFAGHSQLVRSLWLDSQNNRVVSGSYDLDLRVYDFVTGEEIWRAEEWTTSWMLAAKSDYRRIVATSQDGRILIVDFGLQKKCTPDDGQPIDGVDLLRGIDNTNAIEWRDPWERARRQEREREQREHQLVQQQHLDNLLQ